LKNFKINFSSFEKLKKLLLDIKLDEENKNKTKNIKKYETFSKAYEKCLKYIDTHPLNLSHNKIYKLAKRVYDIISVYYLDDEK
jgi:hypothetical protein